MIKRNCTVFMKLKRILDESAFSAYTKLTKVAIPDHVTSIGRSVSHFESYRI